MDMFVPQGHFRSLGAGGRNGSGREGGLQLLAGAGILGLVLLRPKRVGEGGAAVPVGTGGWPASPGPQPVPAQARLAALRLPAPKAWDFGVRAEDFLMTHWRVGHEWVALETG